MLDAGTVKHVGACQCRSVKRTSPLCRSELAREELTGTAFIQDARVIVDVFREHARSYT